MTKKQQYKNPEFAEEIKYITRRVKMNYCNQMSRLRGSFWIKKVSHLFYVECDWRGAYISIEPFDSYYHNLMEANKEDMFLLGWKRVTWAIDKNTFFWVYFIYKTKDYWR